jgi:hypothetical protein
LPSFDTTSRNIPAIVGALVGVLVVGIIFGLGAWYYNKNLKRSAPVVTVMPAREHPPPPTPVGDRRPPIMTATPVQHSSPQKKQRGSMRSWYKAERPHQMTTRVDIVTTKVYVDAEGNRVEEQMVEQLDGSSAIDI